jgi:protein ImuB
MALDRALGRLPDPRPYYSAPPRYQGSLELPGAVDTAEGLVFGLHRLLQELGGFLIARGVGASALTLSLHHPKRTQTEVVLGLVAPSRDVERLFSLWRERLARVELAAPVEEITLRVDALVPLAERNRDFFAPQHAEAAARAALIERLQARLGNEAVHSVALVAEHRPERAWREVAPGSAHAQVVIGRRPVWLLVQPLALEQRDARPWLRGSLALEAGPERIESGWWDSADVRRDYFVARDPQGVRFWVFRELGGQHRWFLHGIFG